MTAPNDKWDLDTSPLTEDDRDKIVGRIHSSLYWLGKFVPEEEILEGEEVHLRDVIFKFVKEERPSEDDVRAALSLADAMQSKARELEASLKSKDHLTKGQAHMLLDEICGLLRGVDEVRTAKGADAEMKARILMTKVKDERRWQDFLKSVSFLNDITH